MLKLIDIKKEYKSADVKVEALKGINLEFRKSEFVSILGPSGCGKTTLLNIIGGLDKYTSGDLIINQKSTKNYTDRDWDTYRNRSIGFVFQSYNLIMHQTILSNVELALTLSGVKKEERKQRAIAALEKVGLGQHIYKRPNQLSGGQMQRVAIARAIINDPEIILADEPTGALDTDTSVQIMEILKEISKDRLVIMVTHNPELAKQYSTRIIKLLDGNIIDDNNPYNFEKDKNKNKNKTSETNKGKKKNTSMSFFTALHLSINNLRTKKGRTFMTAFAGSIGIIGVALVLAISNGFSGYINTMQSDTLSAYPITVSTATIDYDKFNSFTFGGSTEQGENNNEYVVVYDSVIQKYIQYGHYNNITKDFIDAVTDFNTQDQQKPEDEQALNLVQFSYFTPLKFIYTDAADDDKYKLYVAKNSISVFTGTSAGVFYQELDNEDFMLQQYDVIYTSADYNKDDIYGLTLVVDDGNRISRSIMSALGIKLTPKSDGTYENITFADICTKEYKLIFNNDYYSFDSDDNVQKLENTQQAELQTLYENPLTQSLKVTRVLRQKEDSQISLLNSGVMYTKELGELYRQNCKTSEIAIKQEAKKATQTNNYTFYAPLDLKISEFSGVLPPSGFKDTTSINDFLNLRFNTTVSIEDAYQLAMQQIGISTTPQTIMFYAKNFEGKKAIEQLITNFNKTASVENQIISANQAQLITTTLGSIVSIISYVLIAFASISLIVSSIMIGVITYTSVIERTKEIGVLRSLGARKKDVSRVFNAETAIIGALSGAIGVAISYLLCIPISLIIKNLSDISNIASLSILHAIALIVISTILSLIAGLVPSRYAAKKDPVTALRSE